MAGLWRLVRNQYGRAAYDALARAGITATLMYEYVRRFDDAPPTAAVGGADRVTVCDPAAVAPLEPPVGDLEPAEAVVGAFVDGTPAGYLFLSVDASHEIAPLERRLSFDGAYLRRVYVDPAFRNRGIATALVASACARARDRGAKRATALVALDNVPSRSLFTGQGFEPVRTRRYVRVGPASHRSSRTA